MARNFTTGNATKQLTSFAMPLVVTMILQNLYNVADMIVVGRFIGEDALAAVGTTGSLSMFVLMFMQGASMGMGVVVSQFFGAKDETTVKKTIVTSFYLICVLAVVFGSLGAIFAKQILSIIQVPANLLDDAKLYLRIIFCGSLATAMYNMVGQISRSTGDSVTPMLMLVVSSVLNIGMNILFVVSFGLGVAGVGYATVLATILAAVVCFIYTWKRMPMLHPTRDTLKPDFKVVRMVLKVGVPSALQSSVMGLGQIAVQSIVNGYGASVIAAYVAATKIEALVSYPPGGYTGAMQVFAGQNVGVGNFQRVRHGFRVTLWIIIGYTLVSSAALIISSKQLIGLFTEQGGEALLRAGSEYLLLAAIGMFFCGQLQLCKSTLNGAGDAMAGVWISGLELTGRVVGAFLLARFFGYIGAFAGTPIGWLLAAVFGTARYLRGGWTQKRLTKAEPDPVPALAATE
jgi:putative MATE family efflux protein